MRARDILWTFILGCLMALSVILAIHPGVELFWLVWFALAGLFFVIEGKSFKQAFALGMIAAVAVFLICFRWVPLTVFKITNSYIVSFAFWTAMVLYVSLCMGLCFGLTSFIHKHTVRFQKNGLSELVYLLSIPALWVSIDYISLKLIRGFPWMHRFYGYTQLHNLRLIQIAEFTAVYGVTFLIVLVNLSVCRMIKEKRFRQFGIVLLIFLLCFCYGFWQIDVVAPKDDSGTIKAAILQANIPATLDWHDKEETANFIAQRYLELNREVVKHNPDLIVWSETAIPWPLTEGDDLIETALRITKPANACHLVGIPAAVTGQPGKYYNTAFFILPDGRIISSYDKIVVLGITGEELLDSEFLRGLGTMGRPQGYIPGERQKILQTPLGKIGIFICNENIYPDFIRNAVKLGAEYIVGMSNDSWFPCRDIIFYHCGLNVFRAIENRRDIATCSSAGISAFIDAYGRTRSKTETWKHTYLVDKIKKRQYKSFYVRYGDLFAKLCLVFVFLVISHSLYKNYRVRKG